MIVSFDDRLGGCLCNGLLKNIAASVRQFLPLSSGRVAARSRIVVAGMLLSQAMALSVSADTLNQDAFAVEKGPHFFDNECCFCKPVTSVSLEGEGYTFHLEDGRQMFVEDSLIRSSSDDKQWYCPEYGGAKRCGLIQFGS